MKFIPSDSLTKLEFDKIVHILENGALGEPGKNILGALQPSSIFKDVMLWLSQSEEFIQSNALNEKIPLGPYQDILSFLSLLKIENYVLELEELLEIRNMLFLAENLFKYFTPARKIQYPNIWNIVSPFDPDTNLIFAFKKVFIPEGTIRSDASEELVKIRKKLSAKQSALEKQFRFLLNNFKAQGFLAESGETIRNGRKVLCVLSEYKRRIKGIIHDESSTGKSTYIEPEEMIELNNDIFDLEQDERREIYKILRDLCNFLSTSTHLLENYQEIIVQLDVIQSKAVFSQKYKGTKPKLLNRPNINIQQGFHPILLLKNNTLGHITVPFNMHLMHNNRIIIISGPNAGGKSIALKAAGLMQVMLQSGILIPVAKESEFGMFETLFVDIGDQQSIENDLSTYSSRLRYNKEFLEIADENALAIIDELGSGTDPQIGGAIAESIIREIHKKQAFAVITTHYGNLKIYAHKTKGIVNASMHFDKELLKPSFELLVGKPGSSYAFEIAQKSGLSTEMLDYAKHKTGKNEKAIDEVLGDLQSELKKLQDKVNEIKDRELFLDNMIKNYSELQKSLDFNKKKFKLDQKENKLQAIAIETKNFEKLARELKAQNNAQKAKEIAEELKNNQAKLEQDIIQLEQEVVLELPTDFIRKPLELGDFVRIKTGGAIGKVLQLDKSKALVQMGEMTLTVKIKDLIGANEPIENQSYRGIKTNLVSGQEMESKVDLRGMRKDEALKVLENFVDNALINNVHILKILHGKGDGILKKTVWVKLKEYKDVSNIAHPEEEFGGTGVTLVTL